ncbi:hypothetical protein [Evansella cellulosilytica]|uniref:Uncharacterized protein n=1 Tax=Evansella cellulosilytica (strain ATCC 21833 / DSM 2522 / FERM P-1141 / JCM 9156 / N-4) TaxID=649639 RepID=E6TVH6_EVAC2|nr:hypothetical protein [Evansella cellulosilytica]ADU30993.1 hypothetical protein Bcell_2738 [Evansella cellulosilytica DSM 2522]
MADYTKSSEGKVTTLECFECGFREVFTERQIKTTDGMKCYVCNGIVTPTITRSGEKIRNRRMLKGARPHTALFDEMHQQNLKQSIGKLTVDIDCSDALKGLKAIQREAKKATAALKELEEQQKKSANINAQIVPSIDLPKIPHIIDDVPDHVKNYGKSKTYEHKGLSATAWFKGSDSNG